MERWWEPALRDVFAGRRVIVVGGVPASWVEYVEHLWTAGASAVMIVATEGAGVGDGPDVPTVVVEPPAGVGMMERIRFGNRALADPPVHVLDAIQRFDPTGEALVVGSFLLEAPTVAGRPALSYRRPEWIALEDKTVVDAFWDRAGVARLPSCVVPVADAEDASHAINRGAGTVWAADARDGFHGGAYGTRRVVDATTAERAAGELGTVADRVRVMPFVDGIPCSIHGIVLADGVAVLRPVEMVTLRRDADLVYTGCATFWDPPEVIRDQMRAVARRVAAGLASEVDFRGTFTIDGVVDADGFWPTELNPRFGAGINVIARAEGNLPILLVHDLAVAGRPIGLPADALERRLIDHADAHRAGGTWTTTAAETVPIDERSATFDGTAWSWAGGDDAADATVHAAPGFTRCAFSPRTTPAGPSVGRRAAAFWRFADRELATGLGELAPPPDPFR